MRGLGKVLIVVVFVGAGVAALRLREDRPVTPTVERARVTFGDVVQVVTATGTLAPARSVSVGSQVSGVVTRLLVDYNSVVKAGQVLATIDPAKLQTQLEVAQASRLQAESALESDEARHDNDERGLERMDALVADQQETADDRDTAWAAVLEDAARLRQDQAGIDTANIAIEQAKIALARCTITSPIDGVVVARDVDAGQTINASVVSPTLYELASDLTTLRLIGAIDEADVAAVRPGETARFTVDAYPGVTFRGVVRELRLNAATVNNVVTYQTVIDVKNADLRLRPGMTAHFILDVGRSSNVLRVPVSALRFRPTAASLAEFPDTVLPTDSAVAPLIAPGEKAQVWKVLGRRLIPVAITLGRTDGQLMEVVGDLSVTDEVVSPIIKPVVRFQFRRR